MKLKPVTEQPAPLTLVPELVGPEPTELVAAKPVTLSVRLAAQAGQEKALDDLAGTEAHVLMASRDLSWFGHEHAHIQKGGIVDVKAEFPRPGEFVIFFDPESSALAAPLMVKIPGAAPAPTELRESELPAKLEDEVVISLVKHERLKAGATTRLTFIVNVKDKPATDLQPLHGELGHLVLIPQDASFFVHAHTSAVAGDDRAPAKQVSGPELSFDVKPAAPGLYRVWLEVRRDGKPMTAPFALTVQP
jgi:hypothetical protein